MSYQAPERSRCPICRAEVSPGKGVCGACGSNLDESLAEQIRSVNDLLSELSRWENEGSLGLEQARELRESYERRREELRAQLSSSHRRASPPVPPPADSSPRATKIQSPRRSLLATLADPRTIRILLYSGAAMLVVGVVIWLRDILYLKLQEPIVQATLLAIGTIAVTFSGWVTILRTRLLLTGRALTLIGSLLVPVNFWFLARSGLFDEGGRAWLVCTICALLYGLTAAILREKLYVYLASLATISTVWAIIYRIEREAFGLYALALMIVSLAFLHLSRLFPVGNDDGRLTMGDKQGTKNNPQSAIRNPQSPLSYQLWGTPLVHVALVGAALSLLFYMPLRFGSSSSFSDGLLRLRASEYDAGTAILLFAAIAYATWFTGRRIFTQRRAPLYTTSALALFCIESLVADGLRLSGSTQLLLLAATSFITALTARALESNASAVALHRASLTVIVVLAAVTYPVMSIAPASPFAHSLILILLALTYAVSCSVRFDEESAGETLAHVSLAYTLAALFVVQAIIHLRVGDPLLLAPSVALGTTGLLLLGASLRVKAHEHLRYFRAGLFALVVAFVLAALHAGYDPVSDVELYTSPVAILLLFVAHLRLRGSWIESECDMSLLLWAGSVLLAAPLLLHALQYRLLLDVPAPWRDLMALCASLALVIFGVVGRLRAPVIIGATALALELSSLALTSVDWIQIPLKVYLISTGALILLIWGLLEFRHEQILRVRERLNERRETARERFGEWK
jgi:hypothetical protein